MPVDFAKLQRLSDYTAAGNKPAVCEVLAVYWSDSVTKYYAISKYDTVIPFYNIPLKPIEARLVGKVFQSFSLISDLTTESIPLTFSDGDRAVETLFGTYGEGIKCELFYYYPKIDDTNTDDLLYSAWWGHLGLPDFAGRGVLQVTAENGFKSRELLMGRRIRPDRCTAFYGGLMTNINEYRGNGCIYDRQLGGSNGNLDGSSLPFPTCDKTAAACIERLGALSNGKPRFWMGFDTSIQSVVTDPHSGYIAVAKGNANYLKEPIRVVAGFKYVSTLNNLFYRKEIDAKTPEHGFVRGVWEVCEGPVQSLSDMSINDQTIQSLHVAYMNGWIGQPQLGYTPDMPNFTGTALVLAAYGWVNAATTELASLATRIFVAGFNEVRVYSDSTTFTKGFSMDRVWWLLELYSNMRFGRGYRHNRFNILDLIDVSHTLASSVTFTDPFNVATVSPRSTFNCSIDGRPTQEVIIDICRSGRISVPYQYNGQYTISALTKWPDLSTCKVFSDRGSNPKIWKDKSANYQTIKKSEVSNIKIPNSIVLSFEDPAKFDRARPLTFVDEPQQQAASLALGDSSYYEVSKSYSAFGIRNYNECLKFGYSLLHLGEFDTGGTKNNQRIEFNVFREHALGLKKFEVINVDSDVLDNSPFKYFRVQNLKYNGSTNLVTITAQAYPETYYETFETEVISVGGVCSIDSDCGPGYICDNGVCVPAHCSIDTDCPDGYICRAGICIPDLIGPGCKPSLDPPTFADGVVILPIIGC